MSKSVAGLHCGDTASFLHTHALYYSDSHNVPLYKTVSTTICNQSFLFECIHNDFPKQTTTYAHSQFRISVLFQMKSKEGLFMLFQDSSTCRAFLSKKNTNIWNSSPSTLFNSVTHTHMHTNFKANLITSFSCYINLPLGISYLLTAKQIYYLPFILKSLEFQLQKVLLEPNKKILYTLFCLHMAKVQIISMTFLWLKREVRSLSQETLFSYSTIQLHYINGIKVGENIFTKEMLV